MREAWMSGTWLGRAFLAAITRRALRPPARHRGVAALAFALIIGSLTAAALPAAAAAEGGTEVAKAPALTSGTQVEGNTKTDAAVIEGKLESGPVCVEEAELWTLEATAGDELLLKGEGAGFEVEALPPGVTEAMLQGSAKIPGAQAASLKAGLSFAALKTGKWLVVVGQQCNGSSGPYKLTATVVAGSFAPGPGGGDSIGTAPDLEPGVQVSGNTATDAVIARAPSISSCMRSIEAWKLQVSAGDQVLLKGDEEAPAEELEVAAIPPVVTEPALFGESEIADVQHGSLEAGLTFAAAKTGTWLVIVGDKSGCSASHAGPYRLTAHVYPGAFAPGPGGGDSIGAAPALTAGEAVSGNTAQGKAIAGVPSVSSCMRDVQVWKLDLAEGDHALLKGVVEAPAAGFEVVVLPPGVNEAALFGSTLIQGRVAASLESGVSFKASESGTWLVVIGDAGHCQYGHSGPYELTTMVTEPPPKEEPPATPKLSHVRFASRQVTAKHGAKLHLTLSREATVTVSILQILHGRRHKAHCRVHAKHGHRCKRLVHRKTVKRSAVAGADTLKLSLHGLKPGRYKAKITARNSAGGVSNQVRLSFQVNAHRHHRHRRR